MNFYFQLILKSPKNYENLGFLTSGLCLAFKNFFGLFFNFPDLQMSWIFQIIQIWIILKQFCHQIIFAEKFANRISVYWATARAEGFSARLGSWPFSFSSDVFFSARKAFFCHSFSILFPLHFWKTWHFIFTFLCSE